MKKYMTFSNVLYASSVLFSVGVILKVYIDRASLPPGVCPVTNNNHWMYLAIGFLIISTLVSTLADRRKKSADKEVGE